MATWTENNDAISGTAGNDVIDALGGNDLIFASGGIDQINGGTGDDKIVIAPGLLPPAVGGRTYTIGANSLTDSTGGLNTSFTSVEVIQIQNGNSSDTIDASGFVTSVFGIAVEMQIGNGNNSIIGSNYSDFIFLGTGSNAIDGRGGNDLVYQFLDTANPATVYVTNTGGTVLVTQGAVQNSFTSIETLHLAASGNANTVTIDASACVTSTNIAFDDHNGTDIFTGSSGLNFFSNFGGNSTGNDVFTGNGGSDWYTYHNAAGSMNGDIITDFDADDSIDLRGNDPASAYNGNFAYLFIGNAAFSGVAGQYRYQASGGQTQLQVDTNGDGIADQVLTITNGEFALGETVYGPNILQITGPAIPSDQPADAQDDAFTSSGLGTVTGNLFADNGSGADSDPDGPALAIAAVNGSGADVGVRIALASGAHLTVNGDGTFTYEPNGAQVPPASDSFTYSLAGGDTATVNLTIENDNAIIGTDANNRLIGGDGNDAIYGLGGADYLTGGNGDDLVSGGDGAYDRAGWYQVGGTSGATVDLRLQGQAQNTGSQGWDTLVGIENLSGTPFADTLTGDANDNWLWGSNPYLFGELISTTNNDTLDGQEGNDLLTVGNGNHTLIGGAGIDTVQYSQNGGPETAISINLFSQGGPQATGAGSWTLTGIENLSGGEGNDFFQGDGNANVLAGAAGSDTINGGGGNDRIYGDGAIAIDSTSTGPITEFPEDSRSISGVADGNDFLSGGGGDDALWGGGGNDRLVGGGNNDANYGGTGDDYITGGFGDDLIDGGVGIDRAGWYQTDESLGGATVDLNIADAQYTGSQGWDTLTSIEFLSGTPFADTFIGDGNDNVLWGSAATISAGNVSASNNDYLDGAGGNDLLTIGIGNHTLIGGSGNDTLAFTENGAAEPNISVALWNGDPQNTGAGTWNLSGIENLFGGVGNDSLEGEGGDNIIGGSLGADVLFGYGGNDTLYGDGYVTTINNVATTFVDSGTDGGNDQLFGGGGDDTLYGGAGHDLLRGNVGNDLLYGGTGDDYLDGGQGDDLLDGGDGYDRLSYFGSATGPVTIDLRIQGVAQDTGQGMDTLIGIEHAGGTTFGDTLIGNDGDNFLRGSSDGAGDDTVDGQGGNDLIEDGAGNHQLEGGTGSDTFLYAPTGGLGIDISLASQGAGQDTGVGMMTLSGFENLSGSMNDDRLTGDGGDNILAGWGGNDRLTGGGGNDTLYGDGAFGLDTHGTLLSGPINLQADAGVTGNDILEGGLGDDLLFGGGGTDTASYANASGAVTAFLYKLGNGNGEASGADGNDFFQGIENLTGSAFADSLGGNNLANVLDGGDGNDGLRGNGGDDTLLGGNGNDFLNGSAGNDIVNGGAGFDRAAFYEDATASGVTVDLNKQGVAQDTGQGFDILLNIENVSGSAYGDTLIGDGGDNQLWGSASTLSDGTIVTTNNDTLSGGGGNDLLQVGIGNHLLDGGSGIDTLRFTENGAAETGLTLSLALQGFTQLSGNGSWMLTGIENLSGGIADDSLTGDGGVNVLAGDRGNDVLSGGGGNDTLYGDGAIGVNAPGSGAIETFADVTLLDPLLVDGNDILEGGDGDDQLYGGGGIDTASYAAATGGVQVSLYDGGFGEAFGAAGYDQLHDMENITGSAFNDTLTGNGAANTLAGGGGDDRVVGNGGNDNLSGGDGADYITGGFGDDVIAGGNGIDRAGWYQTNAGLGGATVDLRILVAQNTGSQGWDTLSGIENLSGTPFADSLTGDNNDNWLWGSPATIGVGNVSTTNNDYLDGQGGNDLLWVGIGNHTLIGGTGIDTLEFTENGNPENALTLSLAVTTAQNTGNGTWTLSGIENLSGGTGDDWLTGDGQANTLSGRGGNDFLNGGLGADLLIGGVGNDYYFVDNAGDVVVELLGEGYDTVDTSLASYTMGANVDELRAGLATSITGNALANTIYGGSVNSTINAGDGDDYIKPGLGIDIVNGGAGNDFLDINYTQTVAAVKMTAPSAGGDGSIAFANKSSSVAFTSIEHFRVETGGGNDSIATGAGDDVIMTGAGTDTIKAGAGNDLLDGQDGADAMSGEQGNDIYYVNNAGDQVIELLNQGIDTIRFMITAAFTIPGNVENIQIFANSGNLTDNLLDNVIGTTGGDDLLYLKGGNDTISTSIGNDTIDFQNSFTAADSVNGGLGNDTVILRGNVSATLGANSLVGVETLNLVAGAFDLTMHDGNVAAGALLTVAGGGLRAAEAVAFNGSAETDGRFAITCGAGNDTILGGQLADTINGGNGNDRINGCGGNDLLTGGGGADTFVITAGSGQDHVTDFAGVDAILFDALTGVDDFLDLLLTSVGRDTMISWGTADSLILDGVRMSSLDASDFQFTAPAVSFADTSLASFDSGHDAALMASVDMAGHAYLAG